jgi:hypothetical protein
MVASNRIRCTVVAVEVSSDRMMSRGVAQDLLPWADPYVAQLIRNLQQEVRQERQMKSLVRQYQPGVASATGLSTSRRISAVR